MWLIEGTVIPTWQHLEAQTTNRVRTNTGPRPGHPVTPSDLCPMITKVKMTPDLVVDITHGIHTITVLEGWWIRQGIEEAWPHPEARCPRGEDLRPHKHNALTPEAPQSARIKNELSGWRQASASYVERQVTSAVTAPVNEWWRHQAPSHQEPLLLVLNLQ